MSRELGCWWCCCAAHQAKMRAGISIYCWLVTGPARTVCQTAYLPTYLPTGAISDKFGDCSYTKWFWILSSSVWFLLKDWRKHLTSALQIATVAYPIRTSTSPTYVCLLLARPWGTQPKSHSHPTGGFFPISQILFRCCLCIQLAYNVGQQNALVIYLKIFRFPQRRLLAPRAFELKFLVYEP